MGIWSKKVMSQSVTFGYWFIHMIIFLGDSVTVYPSLRLTSIVGCGLLLFCPCLTNVFRWGEMYLQSPQRPQPEARGALLKDPSETSSPVGLGWVFLSMSESGNKNLSNSAKVKVTVASFWTKNLAEQLCAVLSELGMLLRLAFAKSTSYSSSLMFYVLMSIFSC